MPDNQTATDNDRIAEAVMEALQTLRWDPVVETLPAGSHARKSRIRSLLGPVAAGYGMSVEDLAMSLAKSLPYPHEARYA